MQFYQKTTMKLCKDTCNSEKSLFLRMSYTICRNGFPNAFVGFAVNCHRTTAC